MFQRRWLLGLIYMVSTCVGCSGGAGDSSSLSAAAEGAPADPSAPQSNAVATASAGRPEATPDDSLVVVQYELDGKPVFCATAVVLAADDSRAYLAVRNFRTMDRRGVPKPPLKERFIAVYGPKESERRVELERMAEYKDARYTIFAAPKDQLPAPLPLKGLPDLTEGEELRYNGARIRNDQGSARFERQSGPVHVGKIVSDALGRPEWITMAGGGEGLGLLSDSAGRIVALCTGRGGGEAMALPTDFLKPQLNTQLGEMRIRVAPDGDDDVVLDFWLQTFDPFNSGLTPKLLVSHPSVLESRKPDHERLSGMFLIDDGAWEMPPEGTVVELKKTGAFADSLEIPPAPNAWCKESKWVGTYRFRRDEKFLPVWYQAVLVDGSGKIKSMLGGGSHVKVRSNDPQPILFVHPVSQYEAGRPIGTGVK